MPTTLSTGQIAIVGYNSEDLNNPDKDTISFVLLAPIETGTQIFFTDRAWNGTSFATASADENTFTYTAPGNLPTGTVVQITTAQLNTAGIDLADTGETIYAYQGSNANTPTTFLFAANIADGDNTFNGNLTGTGLSTAANTAVAIDEDNASFAARAHNIQIPTLLDSIADPNDWVGNDNSLQTAPNGNYFNTPDQQMWVMASGGGNAFIRLDRDGASLTAEEVTHILQNTSNDGDGTNNTFRTWHPTDIAFDTVNGKVFVADSDGSGHNRILQYNIADFLNNPGVPPQATILYQDTATTTGIVALQLDKARGLVYFGNDTRIYRIDYDDPANPVNAQTPEVAVHLGTGVFVQDFVMDLDANGNGTAYIVNSSIQVSFGADNVTRNFLYSAAITPTSTTVGANATQMEMDQNDTDVTGVASTNVDPQAFPKEYGLIKGIDIDPETDILYFTTAAWAADHDGDGVPTSTPPGTAAVTQWGGIWSYATQSNTTGVYNNVWRQDGVNASEGFMTYIEVDTVNNRYYFSDQTGNTAAADDQAVWVGNLGGGTPTMFSLAANIQGLGPLAMDLQNAPTFTASSAATPTVTEVAGPGSGFTTLVQPIVSANVTDVETSSSATQQLAGAQVRISQNFLSGAAHQDRLTINGTTSGTIELGANDINYSYDSATGVMTLSGVNTFDNYEAALALVRYSVSGDNPTDYGTKNARTIAWSVFDGLLYSDEQTTTVNVTGINDTPDVNAGGAGDSASATIPETNAGLSATDTLTVTDPDSLDVTAAVTAVTPTGPTNGISNGTLQGYLTVTSPVIDIPTTGTTAQTTWTFNSNPEAFNYLRSGQNLALAYTVTVTDTDNSNGGPGVLTDTQTVTITIQGTNDAVSITGFTNPAAQTEAVDASAQDIPAIGGTLTVNDLDVGDTLTGSVTGDGTAKLNGGATPIPVGVNLSTLTDDLAMSFQTGVTSTGGSTGLTWTYDPGAANLDFLNSTDVLTIEYTARVNDGTGNSGNQTLTITINGTNDAPVIVGGPTASVSVAENTTTVTTVNSDDPDRLATEAFSILNIIGTDFAHFSINPSTGALSFAPAPDYEVPTDVGGFDNSYEVDVQVSDGLGGTDVQRITVNVTDANDNLPAFTSGSIAGEAENTAATNVVYDADATDADATPATNTIAYSLSSGGDNDLFSIDSATGEVRFLAPPDFETPADANADNVYEITVHANDGLNDVTKSVSIIVTDVNDEAPVFTSGATASVSENSLTTAVAYDADATDADTDPLFNTVTYSLSGTDALDFTIDPSTGEVRFVSSPNYETPADADGDNDYEIIVTASDGVNSTPLAVTVSVTDTNDVAPTITSAASASANENVPTTDVVYTATDDDPDTVGSVVYSLTGADALDFTIDSATGEVRFAASPDFEAPADSNSDNAYEITVNANDGVNPIATKAVTISVTDTNDVAPVFTSGNTGTEAENTAATNVVYDAAATDGDTTPAFGNIAYSLSSGGDNDLFSIDSMTGEVRFLAPPDFEAPGDADTDNAYEITVHANDGTNDTPLAVTISVTDANDEAPVFTSGATASVSENSLTTAVAYDADATDADTDPLFNTVTYSLSGTDALDFTIDPSTGEVRFVSSPNYETPADADGDNDYEIIVTASDGVNSTPLAVTVSVTDTNDVAPTITSAASASANENVPTTDVVYTATADDPDTVGSVVYSLTGDDALDFTIDSATGEVRFAASPDFETPADNNGDNAYEITLNASDGVNPTATKAVIISVLDTNDVAPVLSGVDATPTYNEDAAALVLDATLTLTDPDSANLSTATVTIDDFLAGDVLDADVTGTSITKNYLNGVLTLTGPASPADFQQVLQTVSYRSTSNNPTSGGQNTRTISWAVSDGTFNNAPAPTLTLTIVPSNDAPSADATSGSGTEDGPRIAITLSGTDPDDGDAIDSFAIAALSANGQIYTAATGGTALAVNDTVAAVGNSATVYFQPNANFNGSTSFSYTAFDGVDTSASAIASIDIAAVADYGQDFGGEGKSDILLRHDVGTLQFWEMDGTSVQTSTWNPGLAKAWKVHVTGDFDGDGETDILWRHDNGTLRIWEMNGPSAGSDTTLGPGPTGWSLVGLGDFNGDSKSDFLWRHTSGSINVWEMDGAAVQTGTWNAGLNNSWHIQGTGDFDGDGNSDILWRRENGDMRIWKMDGGQKDSDLVMGGPSSRWHVAEVGDFNGDNKADIAWRHDTGSVQIWEMDGGTVQTSTWLPGLSKDWRIEDTGDYNGDGNSDILWRSNRELRIWEMDGGDVLSDTSLGDTPHRWNLTVHHFDLI